MRRPSGISNNPFARLDLNPMLDVGFGECVQSFSNLGDAQVKKSAHKHQSVNMLASAVKTNNNQRRKTQMPHQIGGRLEMLFKAE